MSIGVASRITGINANTLRMWERRYHLGSSKRSSGGQREYTATDIDHLRMIKKLVDKGMRIGDVAKLSPETLTSLLLDSGESATNDHEPLDPLQTQVVGLALGNYFKTHIRRYPKLVIHFSENDTECWLNDTTMCDKELLILQQNSLNGKQAESIIKFSQKKTHVIVLYLYSNQELLDKMQREGITLLQGSIDSAHIDQAINKVLRLETNLSALKESGKTFDISQSPSHPHQFDELALIEAEALSKKLNCECPPHLTDLIRRLSAFEEYSQTCGAENWKQAAVHACVYSYANKARYLIERALRAVLDE